MTAATHKTFNVWITTSDTTFVDGLVSKLIKRGFTVGPLGRCMVLEHEDRPMSMVAISVYRAPKDDQETSEYTASGIYHEIENVMKVVKGKFISIVVSAAEGCTWNYGNVSIKEQNAERQKKTN